MKKYTVILRYPDYAASDWPDSQYVARTQSESIFSAVESARAEAVAFALSVDAEINDPTDFALVIALEGWPEVVANPYSGL